MDPKDTLSGTYTTATIRMPDGSEMPVLVRKVRRGDGGAGWVVIDDQVIEFEQRFADTETVPADQAPVDTDVLTRRPPVATISSEQSTRIRLMAADMIQFIGDPDRILAQKCLDADRLAHLKAHPSSATMARRICLNIGGKWAEVAQYIPQFYPDGTRRS